MADELPLGGTIAGYRLLRRLGGGGYADVYVAADTRPQIQREVAIKVARGELVDDPAARERFLREALVTGRLNHPNIVPVFDAGEDRGLLYLVMPLIAGSDLDALLAAEGRLDPARALHVVEEVAAALDAAHAAGVVHRDVKPGNILVGRDRRSVWLTDFGLVKPVKALRVDALTQTGIVFGTPNYLAPEQLGGQAVAQSDVYALGCVMVACLTGRPPFAGLRGLDLLRAHVEAAPPAVTARVPELPAAVDDVVARALAKLPEDRWVTTGELATGLRHALYGGGPVLQAPAAIVDPDHTRGLRAAPAPPQAQARPQAQAQPGHGRRGRRRRRGPGPRRGARPPARTRPAARAGRRRGSRDRCGSVLRAGGGAGDGRELGARGHRDRGRAGAWRPARERARGHGHAAGVRPRDVSRDLRARPGVGGGRGRGRGGALQP